MLCDEEKADAKRRTGNVGLEGRCVVVEQRLSLLLCDGLTAQQTGVRGSVARQCGANLNPNLVLRAEASPQGSITPLKPPALLLSVPQLPVVGFRSLF